MRGFAAGFSTTALTAGEAAPNPCQSAAETTK
jgi:hypothetical protein